MPQSALINMRESIEQELRLMQHQPPNEKRRRYLQSRLVQINKEIGALFDDADVARNDFDYHGDKRRIDQQYLVPTPNMWSDNAASTKMVHGLSVSFQLGCRCSLCTQAYDQKNIAAEKKRLANAIKYR